MNKAQGDMRRFGIHKNLTHEELEIGYDARSTVDDFMKFVNRGDEISKAIYQDYPCLKDVAYGDTRAQLLDVFPAEEKSPILLVIHGGYWRALQKEQHAFMVPVFNKRNISCVTIDYGLAPEYRISQIVDHVRRAISWVYNHAAEFRADSNRIIVVGSSAGAHLASMLLLEGWHEKYDVPIDVVKGVCLQSGLFDLTPLVDCKPNEWLQSSLEDLRKNSPVHNQLLQANCNVDVFFAEKDTAEFKAHSMEMVRYLKNSDYQCQMYGVGGSNHYDLFLHLADEQKKITKSLIDMFD